MGLAGHMAVMAEKRYLVDVRVGRIIILNGLYVNKIAACSGFIWFRIRGK